ncbi:MAG TPA: toxin-antitoxin system, antitoxin component, Xre family protein [Thiotrichales bacterium]|nr:toxin-antitoxin system, antitoxin component, Xre family protein [Thiotrichales bacterium]
MATEHDHIRKLIDKLEALSPERIAEVEDFIDFLKSRDTDRQLTHMVAKASEPSFAKVWDNPDDAVYDAL